MTDRRKSDKPIVTGAPGTARPRKPAIRKPAPTPGPADQDMDLQPQVEVAASSPTSGVTTAHPVAPAPARPMSPEEAAADRRARSRRNIVMALGLVAFIVIVYLVTVLKMGAAVAQRPF